MTPEALLNILKTLGLEISVQTGGQWFDTVNGFQKEEGAIKIETSHSEPIMVMTTDLFMKTIRRTEDSLNLKLFV